MVLQVFLSVEGDLFWLDLAVFDIDLITTENNGDILTDTAEVTVPGGDIFVG